MIIIFKNLSLLVISVILSYLTGVLFGKAYSYLFSITEEGFFAFTIETVELIVGTILAFIFFLPLLFTLFGGERKYWWIGVLLILPAIFEIYFDPAHLYFPIILALLGWLLGFGLAKVLKASSQKHQPSR